MVRSVQTHQHFFTSRLIYFSVSIPPAIPTMCTIVINSGIDTVQLRIANLREAQCTGDWGRFITWSSSKPLGCLKKRTRKSPYRAKYQQCPHQHKDQAGRRNRTYPCSQIHPILDSTRRGFFHFETETCQGTMALVLLSDMRLTVIRDIQFRFSLQISSPRIYWSINWSTSLYNSWKKWTRKYRKWSSSWMRGQDSLPSLS